MVLLRSGRGGEVRKVSMTVKVPPKEWGEPALPVPRKGAALAKARVMAATIESTGVVGGAVRPASTKRAARQAGRSPYAKPAAAKLTSTAEVNFAPSVAPPRAATGAGPSGTRVGGPVPLRAREASISTAMSSLGLVEIAAPPPGDTGPISSRTRRRNTALAATLHPPGEKLSLPPLSHGSNHGSSARSGVAGSSSGSRLAAPDTLRAPPRGDLSLRAPKRPALQLGSTGSYATSVNPIIPPGAGYVTKRAAVAASYGPRASARSVLPGPIGPPRS